MKYDKAARQNVKTITVDLFEPYRPMIKRVFTNAIIVTDKFHVVSQVYEALNKIRVEVMNKLPKVNGHRSKSYRHLKRYWKLVLKDSENLDFKNYYYQRPYGHSLSESDIVDDLLSLSPELRQSYDIYQDVLYALHHSDVEYLDNVLLNLKTGTHPKMHNALKTLKKHRNEIITMFKHNYSNGPIEGVHNKIKAIKRTAYGFRSFSHYRARILLAFNLTRTTITSNKKDSSEVVFSKAA
jgi:transposase